MDIPLTAPLKVVETTIEGNNLTRVDTIERQLQGLYNASTLQGVADQAVKAADRLEGLGIFENVELELLPGKHRGEAGLRVSVKEKRVTSLKVSTFVQQGEGGVEFTTRASNALGRAEVLEVTALMGGSEVKGTPRRTQLRCDYSQPTFFGLPASLSVSGDSTSFQPVGENTFEDVSYGVAVRLKSRFGLDFEWIARQRDIMPSRRVMNKEDTTGVLTYAAPAEIVADARPSMKSALSVQYAIDGLLPNSQFPLVGSAAALRMEIASPQITGGNVDLFALSGKLKQAFPLSNEVSLTASLETSMVRPLSGDYVHIQDRLFLGGPMFLRGFHPRGAGPRSSDGTASLGGRNRWQVRIGIEGPPPDWTRLPSAARAHIFAAAGGISNEANLEHLFKKDVRLSVGCGLAFSIASARLEANAVYVLKADKNDATSGRLQFGLGAEFL